MHFGSTVSYDSAHDVVVTGLGAVSALGIGANRLFEHLSSGQTLIGAEIAKELGVTDRGREKPSYREMLGSPRPKNPAAVY